jgi:hypothetical protein
MTTPKPVRIPVISTTPPRLRLTVIRNEEVTAMRTFPPPSEDWVEQGYNSRVWESMLAGEWFRRIELTGLDPDAGDRIESEYV